MKRIALALCIAVAATFGCVWLVGQRTPQTVRLERWPLDVTRTYSLTWQQRQSSAVGGTDSAVTGELKLEGRVSLTPRLLSDGAHVVVMTFEELSTFEAAAMGQKLPADGLKGAQAWVRLDPNGALADLRFSDREGPAARYLLQGLAGELFAPEPGDAPLTVKERLAIGDLYTVLAWSDSAHTTLVRKRLRFLDFRLAAAKPASLEFDARAEFSFSGAGPLEGISSRESVTGADAAGAPQLAREASLWLKLVDQAPAAPERLMASSHSVVRAPGPLASEIDQTRALLESRVGDLTFEAMASTFEQFSDPASIPQRAGFVWRASGLLMLQPGRAKELVPVFTRATSDGMRAQLLDVLASAGTPQSQAAMKQMLQSPAARLDARVFEELYQRVGLVTHPTRETVQWVLDDHAAALHAADAAARRMRAYTLGSLARHVRSTDASLAQLSGDVLLDDLAQAKSADDTAHALRALGNAGDPRTVDAVKTLGSSLDPNVRASAALALRQVTSPDAERTLTGMLRAETDGRAQAATLEALRHRTLGPDALTAVRELALDRLAHGSERALLALLSEQPRSPEVVQALQAVITSTTTPASLRQQARALLSRFTS